MASYVTVDGGTTNTRVSLVADGSVLDTVKLGIGAGARDREALARSIKGAIVTLVEKYGMTEGDIRRILASGMITSEYGLCELAHITAPVGIGELHGSMYEMVIDQVSSVPFVFIRGVKTACEDIGSADMMRGEETELMGLLDGTGDECVYVLPGTHSKIVRVDREGRITDFSTMMTGEMIAALSGHTILRDAVALDVSETDSEYLFKGYEYCLERGINEALFKTRVLKNLFSASGKETYSFFLGAVLCAEMRRIMSESAKRVVISGQSRLAAAGAEILRKYSDKEVIVADGRTVSESTCHGAVRIYENKS